MKATTVKEVLTAARWIIDNVGWCQKYYYKTKAGLGRFDVSSATDVDCACSIGAIYLTEASPVLQNQALDMFDSTLNDVSGVPFIATWNDKRDRTKEEVLAVFDKAIKRAK